MNKKTCALIFTVLVIINAFPQTVYADNTVIKPQRGVRSTYSTYIYRYTGGGVCPESHVIGEGMSNRKEYVKKENGYEM